MSSLKAYRRHLSRVTHPFFCPRCDTPVLPKDFEKHCFQHHGLNPKSCCVWCSGAVSWNAGEKNEHSNHLKLCFQKLYATPTPTPKPLNMNPMCATQTFFQHPNTIREHLPERAFGPVWPLEASPHPLLPFQDENLNLAASYLQAYLETRQTHDWLHVMVKAVAFESFLAALEDGSSRTLEFSCWCDGGHYEDDLLRQHRHMIVVCSPKDHFKNEIWPQVKLERQPCRNFPCKGIKIITSPLHLLYVLGYLSKRKSRCHFVREQSASPKDHHFYISKTLPVDYKLPLATLWEEGVHELLYREKFQNVCISSVAETPLFRVGSQWRQKIKHFYNLERGLVIPVAKQFVPTQETTLYFLHTGRGRKLYFKPSPEPLDPDAWLRVHVEGGNSFYDAVEGETWTPRPRDQKQLNNLMPLFNRNRELESKLAHLEKLYEEAVVNGRRKQAIIDEMRKGEIIRLKEEIQRLKRLKTCNDCRKHYI